MKYDEIMDKVSVDEAMRNRILSSVTKRKRSYYFPTIAVAAVITAVAVGVNMDFDNRPEKPPLTAEQNITAEPPVTVEPPVTAEPPVTSEPPIISEPPVTSTLPVTSAPSELDIIDRPPVASKPPLTNTVNEIRAFDTLKDLEKAVGFPVEKLPVEAETFIYKMYMNTVAEIMAKTSDGNITLRKSKGSADNSGDFNAYNNVVTTKINDNEVVIKGNSETFTLAIMTDGEYTWSLTFDSGVTTDTITNMFEEMIKAE